MLVAKVEDLFVPLFGGKTQEERPLGILERGKVSENTQAKSMEPEPEPRQVGPKNVKLVQIKVQNAQVQNAQVSAEELKQKQQINAL